MPSSAWWGLLAAAGVSLCGAARVSGIAYRPFTEDPPIPAPAMDDYDGVLLLKFHNGLAVEAAAEPALFFESEDPGLAADLAALNLALGQALAEHPEPTFSRPAGVLRAEHAEAESSIGEALPDLTRFFDVRVPDHARAVPLVETAYLRPHPAPPPTADLSPNQGYLHGAASNGYDVFYAWSRPGGNGSQAKLIDIEYDWTFAHEDLKMGATNLLWGNLYSAFGPDHGNASLGISAALSNGFGIHGIVHRGAVYAVSSVSAGYWVMANAVNQAVGFTAPGDVILIEQQASNTTFGAFCPVEMYADVYSAIVNASALGRVVIEPAGNGGLDLDHPGWSNIFQRATRDSSAILVGAGVATNRARCVFPSWGSCYGSRLDIQGWGDSSVATLGYGDLAGTVATNRYTRTFGGTSSASALSAAVAAALQSYARVRHGLSLTPRQVRANLAQSGYPQTFGPAGAIGPLPNLRNAFAAADALAGLHVAPADGLSAAGFYGGPFAPSNKVYALTNTWTAAVTWAASHTQAWLQVAPTGGTLAAGAVTQLTVSIQASATSLPASVYAGPLVVTNVTGGLACSRPMGLNITPAPQVITFTNLGPQTATNVVLLNPTASSGLPVALAILSGPGVLAGSNLSFTGIGAVQVGATQAGNQNWLPAAPVINLIQVNPAVAGLALQPLNQVYDGTPRVVYAVTTPTGLPTTVTYNGVTAPPVPAGMYTVNGQVVDPRYVGALQATLTVARASQVIAFAPIPDQVVTSRVALSAAADSGLPVAFQVSSGPAVLSGGAVLSFTGTGRVTVSASQGGDANWNPAPPVARAFAVSKVSQTLAFPPIPDQVVTSRVTLSAAASSGLPVSFAVRSGPGRITGGVHLAFTGTGTVVVAASQAGNATWSPAPTVERAVKVGPVPSPIVGLAGGDYDGDGKADPSLYDARTGTWRVRLSTAGYERFVFAGLLGGSGWLPAPADYDGDRRSDPAVYRPGAGDWELMLSAGGYASLYRRAFLDGRDSVPCSGDFDGDARADYGLYQEPTGAWTLKCSSIAYGLVALPGFLGGTGRSAAPSDFDGDGKADPAVYTRADGTWTVRLSGAGYAPVSASALLGGPGWLPVPADYDGDRKADPAVMRPDSGDWAVRLSGSRYDRFDLPRFLGGW